MGYRKEVSIKVKFLVDKNGNVQDITFYTNSKYGFEREVEKALKQWKFEPVIYNGTPTPIYFYKIFKFVP
jgi:protein TonB